MTKSGEVHQRVQKYGNGIVRDGNEGQGVRIRGLGGRQGRRGRRGWERGAIGRRGRSGGRRGEEGRKKKGYWEKLGEKTITVMGKGYRGERREERDGERKVKMPIIPT